MVEFFKIIDCNSALILINGLNGGHAAAFRLVLVLVLIHILLQILNFFVSLHIIVSVSLFRLAFFYDCVCVCVCNLFDSSLDYYSSSLFCFVLLI